jgi:type II secretory pathway component PulF
VYSIPVLGTLIHCSRLTAFTELLAILIENAIPLPEAYRLAAEASSEPFLTASAAQVQGSLEQGQRLGGIMRTSRLTPELIAWMVGVGEERGDLPKALRQLTAIYRRQVEVRATFLKSVLPPFMIVVTAGALVMFFAISVFLPLIKLIEGLAK